MVKLLTVQSHYQSNNDIKTADNESNSYTNTDNEIYSDIELIDL